MKLDFMDYWGGSGQARVSGGFYLVAPCAVPGEYSAKKSDGKAWVWDGGSYSSAEAAQTACQHHYDKGVN